VYRAGTRFWYGTVEDTWWFYFTGNSTDEVWEAYLAHCRAMLESSAKRPALVCLAHRADSPTAEQRRIIADFINKEGARLRSVVGFALVLDSPLHILALKAINWFARKPFQETVCGSPEAAALWLSELGAVIDSATFMSALRKSVPREHMWSA
jgi:hypothetical protein